MQAKKSSGKPKMKSPPALSSSELPASQAMLQLVREELKADNRELRAEMKAGFKQQDAKFSRIDSRFSQIDARFNEVDARFNRVDARFSDMDARFDQMDSKFERVISDVARLSVLVEEQNSRNRIVMEGLSGLWHRQERVEGRVDEMETLVRLIARQRS